MKDNNKYNNTSIDLEIYENVNWAFLLFTNPIWRL
jgi:hypothetical protein